MKLILLVAFVGFVQLGFCALSWDSDECKDVAAKVEAQYTGYSRQEDADGIILDSDDFARMQLCVHNRLRENARLQPLEWDHDIATFITGYLKSQKVDHNCEMDHSSSSLRENIGQFGYIGENLYSSWSSWGTYNMDKVASQGEGSAMAWYNELNDFVYGGDGTDYNTCTHGGVVGHMTQLLWHSTTHLACDYSICLPDAGGYKILIGCCYGPGGNYMNQPAFFVDTYCALNNDENPDYLGKIETCNGFVADCDGDGVADDSDSDDDSGSTSDGDDASDSDSDGDSDSDSDCDSGDNENDAAGEQNDEDDEEEIQEADGICEAISGRDCLPFPEEFSCGMTIYSCADSYNTYGDAYCHDGYSWTYCIDDPRDPDCVWGPKDEPEDGDCMAINEMKCQFPQYLYDYDTYTYRDFYTCDEMYKNYGYEFCWTDDGWDGCNYKDPDCGEW